MRLKDSLARSSYSVGFNCVITANGEKSVSTIEVRIKPWCIKMSIVTPYEVL